MTYLLAALFGVSWGVLLCWIDSRTGAWLPKLCSAVIFLVVVIPLALGGAAGAGPVLTIGITAVLGFILAAGAVWRGHPALDGLSYGARVRAMLLKGSAVRAHRGELLERREASTEEAEPASHTP
ncbi:hypothetical protein K8F61_17045 [Microbacterium resistens]|uniref:Uncharacterized protein n=1 Tax=Microbacterium resistens TaxID=156977 RepID=A0ABY3RTR4_9MICO|nr:hypothetical protein [Microbacterium resistens]UGS26311.1 hypothetical protein K8F61_17045 [Microbacterium resistens]